MKQRKMPKKMQADLDELFAASSRLESARRKGASLSTLVALANETAKKTDAIQKSIARMQK